MPDRNGNFKGQGWSRSKELSWERIFLPKPRGAHTYCRAKVTPVVAKKP